MSADLKKSLSGVLTALITPFAGGAVDYTSLRKLVEFQMEHGVRGFVVSGTTAESPCLTDSEKKKIFETVQAVAGKEAALVVGTGTNNTQETIRLTQEAERWGATAALVVVPYYNKPPQRGLFQHYEAVARASALPVLLYNVPSRTITKLEADTIIELSRVPGIVGIKEASGDMTLARQISQEAAPGFLLTSGDDASYLEMVREGGRGVISVGAHILPREFVRFYERALGGSDLSLEFAKYSDLLSFLYVEANPIPVKAALHLLGIISSPELRLPLVRLNERNTNELKNKMQAVGLI